MWIVGNVEEIKEEEETSEYHTQTHREVEEGSGRPGCRSKFWAHVDCDEEVRST